MEAEAEAEPVAEAEVGVGMEVEAMRYPVQLKAFSATALPWGW